MLIESTFMRYGHSQGGLTGISLNDKAILLLAHSLHFCSQLIRATVFIIVSGKLTTASVNVNNALQIGKACMEAYEKNYIEVVFNKTLGIVGSEEFDLHNLLSLELAGTNSDITVLR